MHHGLLWSGSPSIWNMVSFAFSRHRPDYTLIVHNRQNSTYRYCEFHGHAVIYTDVSLLTQQRVQNPKAAAVVPAIPPAQILKNCLLLTCMGSLPHHTLLLLTLIFFTKTGADCFLFLLSLNRIRFIARIGSVKSFYPYCYYVLIKLEFILWMKQNRQTC